jgi:STE24 endopeptidase
VTTRRAAAPTLGEDAAGAALRLDRLGATLLVVGGATAFVLAALWLVPWGWVPGGRLTPMPVADLFTAQEVRRAEEFSELRRWLGWSSYAVSLLVALLLGLTPLGARLTRRLFGRLRWWLAVPLSVVALLVVGRLATLPLSLRLRQQNLDYGLTRQSLPDWFVDVGRSLLVSAVTTSLLVLVLVALARRWPRRWYVGAAVAVVVLSFAGSLLYPVLVEPLFNRFTSMPPGPFKTSVLRLAEREGVRVDDVLVADASRRTTTLNAYVSGIGGTRRVVVYDTLLDGLGPEEARVVIAHELAHAKHEDVLVGTTLGALGGVVGVGVLALLLDSAWLRRRSDTDGPADPAVAAAVLALVAVGGLLSSPVTNTVSRAIEARADRVSLAVTGDGQAFIGMQRRLALEALHDPTPPAWSQLWFGSHPTVLQRAGLPASLAEAAEGRE